MLYHIDNLAKMRQILRMQTVGRSLVTYGFSAHILNLRAQYLRKNYDTFQKNVK